MRSASPCSPEGSSSGSVSGIGSSTSGVRCANGIAGLEVADSGGRGSDGAIGAGGPAVQFGAADGAWSDRGFAFGFIEFGSNGLNGFAFFAKRFHLSDGLRYCRPLITLAVVVDR